MQELMLHCGGKPATYEELGTIELPAQTKSYTPVGHQYAITKAKEIFQPSLNLEVKDEAYGLAHDGMQMFGVIAFEGEGGAWGPSLGIRNSYDKTLSVGIAMGARVFVCDNLCFTGEAFTVLRKHTVNVLEDLDKLFRQASLEARTHYDQLSADLSSFRSVPIDEELGFANLGILVGRKLITSSVFNEAARYWRKPLHDEHTNRDLYSWYQAVNHGIKKAPPRLSLEAYSGLHARAAELQQELCPQTETAWVGYEHPIP